MFGIVPFRRNNNLKRAANFWDFDSLMDSFFDDSFMPAFFASGYRFKADLRETDNEYIIDAEIPGVDKKDIKLELRDDTLTINVERNEEINEESAGYIRRERRFGSCSRSFYVGDVKQDAITAKYDNGILTVTLPKLNEGKRNIHRIDIQ
ncbi:MAG TPA: Hsp20/alpha crystallin family protein [Clostridiaceae bacterium]|nr:Hsp20/alpha crystallin family protein [Clostridiaceae bacterium]